jgi:hypothetical protein|tara:strand:- start:582 stop:1445 length:864 start_codon:yes stop_codon:yes gene_type:complete
MDFDNWSEFKSLFYQLSKQPLASKEDANLISPATYQPNTTRKNVNVVDWGGWCAVDVDEHNFEGDLKNELDSRYTYICYSTASSREDFPKFRLVFPLTKRVGSDSIKHFWYALNTELNSIGDKQTKDYSRMYYIPSTYSGAFNFIFDNTGVDIDPDELMFKHPYAEKSNLNNFFDRLPEDIKQEYLRHKKQRLDNTNIHWTSYKDCPFFPKKLGSEYRLITNTGWYHKMYQIMVAIAGNAIKKQYPITAQEISKLCRELDMETGNWYENRPLDKEADRALEYVYRNG